MRGLRRRLVVVVALGVAAGCASRSAAPVLPTAPAYRDLLPLNVPDALLVSADVRARHEAAWRRLQSGDLGRAGREYADILRLVPDFYPAATGLGYVASLEGRYDEAARHLDSVIARDRAYLPALSGRLDVALARSEYATALEMSKLVLAIAPGREDVRSRQDVLRLRVLQMQLASASAARAAGRLDEAQAALDAALETAPDSAVVLRELALVEIARGSFDAAETHARRSLEIDAGDPDAHEIMATVLEAHGRLREAVASLERALALDPRPEWRARSTALTTRADFNALPAEFRAIATSSAINRAQLAALLGYRLQQPLAQAPRRLAVVLTDVQSHWAASWILPVTRVGWMEGYANHTFQPSGTVRRAEFAQVVWRVVQDLAAVRRADLARWRAARPVLVDVPRTHLAYPAISGALASGVMQAGADGRFGSGLAVTGAELMAAVARLEQLAAQ